jgi:hypothetical protein
MAFILKVFIGVVALLCWTGVEALWNVCGDIVAVAVAIVVAVVVVLMFLHCVIG